MGTLRLLPKVKPGMSHFSGPSDSDLVNDSLIHIHKCSFSYPLPLMSLLIMSQACNFALPPPETIIISKNGMK